MESIQEQKKHLRKQMRALLKTQDKSHLALRSEKVLKRLASHPRVQAASIILSYWSLPSEAPTHALNGQLAKEKKVLLPVIDGADLYLSEYSPDAALAEEGVYGIAEPTGQAFERYEDVDLVIVPGLAFGKEGQRCGKGKGYYDKTLKKLVNAHTIGLGFDFQMLDMVPMDLHDITLNEVIVV